MVVKLAQRERFAEPAPPELWPLVASTTIHLAAVRRQVLASMRSVLIVGAIALVAATAVITLKVASWARDRRAVTPASIPAGTHGPSGRHPVGGAPRAPDAPRPPSVPR